MSPIAAVSLIFSLILGYIQYFFLAGMIVLLVTAALFVQVVSYPHFHYGFLRAFAFIDPKYAGGSFHMDRHDLLRLISVLSVVMFFISTVIRFILEKIFWITLAVRPKTKLLVLFGFVTIMYGLDFSCVMVKHLDQGFYFVFGLFYGLTCFFLVGNWLLGLAHGKLRAYAQKTIEPVTLLAESGPGKKKGAV